MQWFWIGLIILILLGSVLWWLGGIRTIKTIILISQVGPYEQVGTTNKNILILGDSTGYGTGASKSSESVGGLLGQEFPEYSITNNSANGRTIAELVPIVHSIDANYDLILLQIGGNDVLQKRPIDEILFDLSQIHEALTLVSENIVMISFGNIGGVMAFSGDIANSYDKSSRVFHKQLERFASDKDNFTYINLFDENTNDPFVKEPKIYLAMDGLHPSSAGYGLWYKKLAPVVERILSN